MSDPPAERFTIRSLLAELDAGPGSPADGDALAELTGWFRSECAVLVADCPPEAVPLRLPKARITDLLACERGTLARLGSSVLTEPVVRGRLTDLLVAQHAALGLGERTEDDLRDALEATGDDAVLAWIDDADSATRDGLWAHAELVAHGLRESWGDLPRAWWPRTQERVSVEIADGVLLLAAQFDLVLGGPPTDRPFVVVEVKAGSAADRNRRDLLWYALLAALRHGSLPAVVATWSAADDGLVPVPVTVGAVEAAARRGLAALEVLVGLAGGRPPTVTPHAGCRWCPELEWCEPGQASVKVAAPPSPAGPTEAWSDDGQDAGATDEEPW